MIGGWGLRKALLLALAAPVVGVVVALATLLLMGGVERISPSENVFAPWKMVRDEPQAADMSRSFLERPLLWASRRPLSAAPAIVPSDSGPKTPAGPKNPALAGYRLAGMFVSDFDAGVIVIGPKERRRLVVGQSIDGWMLEEIRENGAVFIPSDSRASKTRSFVELKHSVPNAGNQAAGRTSTKTSPKTAPAAEAESLWPEPKDKESKSP